MQKAIQKKKWTSPKNVYRTKWTTRLDAKVSASPGKLVEVNPLKVLHRFDGGMVYESASRKFLLTENVFGSYPFLLVFELSGKEIEVESTSFHAVPERMLKSIAPACEKIALSAKLPESLHNVEVDITPMLSQVVKLPSGVELSKAILKLGKGHEVACDCDVDGPCGYCCDTCDCDTCKIEDIGIDPMEIVIRGR